MYLAFFIKSTIAFSAVTAQKEPTMRESLAETLKNLHEQLAAEQQLDAQQVAMLRSAAEEIEQTLDRADVSSAGLAQEMQAKSLSFADTHPVLVQIIGRIADLLSQMGI